MSASIETDRYAEGLAKLREIDGEQGDQVIAALADIAPDFARHVIAFLFGDIYTRAGVDLRTRELVAVAALTAMGTAPRQLELHLNAALNVGCRREEIVEILIQMAVFAGFPAALNGLAAARQVFAAHPAAPDTPGSSKP